MKLYFSNNSKKKFVNNESLFDYGSSHSMKGQIKVELIVDEMEAACSVANCSSRQVTSGIKKWSSSFINTN